jgi:hypothetical protein
MGKEFASSWQGVGARSLQLKELGQGVCEELGQGIGKNMRDEETRRGLKRVMKSIQGSARRGAHRW